jgi:hypothetical protein
MINKNDNTIKILRCDKKMKSLKYLRRVNGTWEMEIQDE